MNKKNTIDKPRWEICKIGKNDYYWLVGRNINVWRKIIWKMIVRLTVTIVKVNEKNTIMLITDKPHWYILLLVHYDVKDKKEYRELCVEVRSNCEALKYKKLILINHAGKNVLFVQKFVCKRKGKTKLCESKLMSRSAI